MQPERDRLILFEAVSFASPMSDVLDAAVNPTGTHTSGAGIDVTGSPVYFCLDPLYVGFPHPVRPSMGVTDLNPEGNTLIAILTFCHLVAPPPSWVENYHLNYKSGMYCTRFPEKLQVQSLFFHGKKSFS